MVFPESRPLGMARQAYGMQQAWAKALEAEESQFQGDMF